LADLENVIVDVGTGFYVEKVWNGAQYSQQDQIIDASRARKMPRSSTKRRSRSSEQISRI
jgi:prefoldin subunit 5